MHLFYMHPDTRPAEHKLTPPSLSSQAGTPAPRRRTLNIEQQLRALSLADFIGRQHSGIDVSTLSLTRSIAPVALSLSIYPAWSPCMLICFFVFSFVRHGIVII